MSWSCPAGCTPRQSHAAAASRRASFPLSAFSQCLEGRREHKSFLFVSCLTWPALLVPCCLAPRGGELPQRGAVLQAEMLSACAGRVPAASDKRAIVWGGLWPPDALSGAVGIWHTVSSHRVAGMLSPRNKAKAKNQIFFF